MINKYLIFALAKLPISWRKYLTHSSALSKLRHMTLNLFSKELVKMKLAEPLAGYSMFLDMHSGHRRYALGTYEPQISQLIQKHLKPNQVALDIGANIGYFSLLMAKQVGLKGTVVAFEPIPSVYNSLYQNLSLNHCLQVKAEQKAVADKVGEANMHFDEASPLSFLSKLDNMGNLTVPVITIDDYLKTQSLTDLNFVKIDVEGAEDRVIAGMLQSLQNFKPTVLVEIHSNSGEESFSLNRLQQLDYKLFLVSESSLTPCDTKARGGHVLAIQ
jgi:FkbM family methyltransferase